MKKVKKTVSNKKSPVVQPIVESKAVDFTERALEHSNSKRIRFLKAILEVSKKATKKEMKVSVQKLIGAEYVAPKLIGKVSKKLNLQGLGIQLKASKIELVERPNGTETSGATEVSLVKG